MFDVAPTELLLCAVIALVVIGPKDLPKAMRFVGHWVGKARGMAKHFRSGIDTMMRESELEEMEKKWREHNDAIMRAYPTIDGTLNPTPGAAQIVDNAVVPGPTMAATNTAPAPAHVERSRDTLDPAPMMTEKPEPKPAGETA